MLKINLSSQPETLELPEIKIIEGVSKVSTPLSPVLNTLINSYATAGIQSTGDHQFDQILQVLDYRIVYILLDNNQNIVFIVVSNKYNQFIAINPDFGQRINLDPKTPTFQLIENNVINNIQLVDTLNANVFAVGLVVDGVLSYDRKTKTLMFNSTNTSNTRGNNQMRQWIVTLDITNNVWPVIYYSNLIKSSIDSKNNLEIALNRLYTSSDQQLINNITSQLEHLYQTCIKIPEFRQRIVDVMSSLQKCVSILFLIRAAYNNDFRHTNAKLMDYIRDITKNNLKDVNMEYINSYIEIALQISVDNSRSEIILIDELITKRQDKITKCRALMEQLEQNLNNTSLEFMTGVMNRFDIIVKDCENLYCLS